MPKFLVDTDAMTLTPYGDTNYLLSITDNGKFLREAYRVALLRDPDPAGFAWWLDQLNTGKKTKEQVLKDFVNSPEYTKLHQFG